IYDHAAEVLDRLRSSLLDPADLICRSGDGDGHFVILSPRPGQRIDLEGLAATVERAVEDGLAPMVAEVLREQPRITVGSARVLGNSLLRPERIAARVGAHARGATRNRRGAPPTPARRRATRASARRTAIARPCRTSSRATACRRCTSRSSTSAAAT